jgi:hypothetical protein
LTSSELGASGFWSCSTTAARRLAIVLSENDFTRVQVNSFPNPRSGRDEGGHMFLDWNI